MKLKPLGNRVVVEPLTEEETTKSGIILPDTIDKEKKAEGKILAIGDGEKIQKLGLKEGDTVLFGKYAGEEVSLDSPLVSADRMKALQGQKKFEYKILSDEDVLAVVTK